MAPDLLQRTKCAVHKLSLHVICKVYLLRAACVFRYAARAFHTFFVLKRVFKYIGKFVDPFSKLVIKDLNITATGLVSSARGKIGQFSQW